MRFSLETIDYQYKDSFPDDIQKLVTSICGRVKDKVYKNNEELISKDGDIKKLEKLFMDRLGLNVKFSLHLGSLLPMAIAPFFSDYMRNSNEPSGFVYGVDFKKIVTEFKDIQTNRKATLKSIHNKTGYVNRKLARVGGYLSKVRHVLIMDFFYMVNTKLTEAEITAVMLHELGHAFDGLEEHYRLEKINRSIMDVLNDIHEKKVDKIDFVFKNKATPKEFETAVFNDSKIQTDFATEVAMQYVGEIKTQMLNSKYDETNFENMADTFVARFGRGADLVSALDKIHRQSGQVFNNNRFVDVGFMTLQVFVYTVILFASTPLGALVGGLILLEMLTTTSKEMTYDFPIERYNRVKQTLIQGMKKMDLPKDVLKDFLDQYHLIVGMMDAGMRYKPLAERLAGWVLPTARTQNYHIDLQQELERMLNNDLFVKSAQLRVI